jgi:hypothetical protein
MDRQKIFNRFAGGFNKARDFAGSVAAKLPGFLRGGLQFLDNSRKTLGDVSQKLDQGYNVAKSAGLVPDKYKDKIEAGLKTKDRALAEGNRITDGLNKVASAVL